MQIDITLSAADTTPDRVAHRSVAVIDVFRATSVMVTALEHGIRKIIPVTTVEEAEALRVSYLSQGERVITGGERNAVKIAGFDRDNSPYSYMDDRVLEGKTFIMSTTNGTRAVNASRTAAAIYIAAMLNYRAVCSSIIVDNRYVTLVCSGRENRFTLEDALCAGMMADELLQRTGNAELSDIAWSLRDLYLLYRNDMKRGLSRSRHYNDLLRLGFAGDIDYCLQCGVTDKVPVVDERFQITG